MTAVNKFSNTVSVQLESIDCHKCGGTYVLSERFTRERKADSVGWNCPYCKEGTAFCVSKVDKLEKELSEKYYKPDI